MDQIQKTGGTALVPFLVFVLIFLGAGIVLNDFYALPSPVAVICGIIAAFLLLKGSINAKVDALIRGCGDSQIVTMCIIYLLAGAFAVVSQAIGGVDATVNLGLTYIPVQYLALGVFLLAAFLSTATGTSVGAIVALGPIVVGLAEQSNSPMPLMLGALLGGSMFGDNLSFISDTTIAATQTQECEMKDKFKVNFLIAGPAALLTIGMLLFAGFQTDPAQAVLPVAQEIEFIKIVPYLLVLFLAMYGINVFVALIAGIVASGAVGIIGGDLDVLLFSKKIYEGFTSMTEIFLLSMLTGGLAEMVRQAGGIQFLLNKANKFISGYRSSQLGVGLLVSGVNSAIANNTVSIVVTGPVAKDISQRYHIDKRKTAAILDIFACIVQGLLPYGAQILIMLSFTKGKISYLEVLTYAWYLYLLLFFTVLAIVTPLVDKFFQNKPATIPAPKAVAA
ncbi:Na+/H+ antiporter NhaC family protein [Pontibacter sp. BT310]|uniref:Na+/H+ antiporter NhaC family protein n=1 Tax=Pontibacter populi TaxID=890055 RepID=A0ABS6X6B3_9BACT|nr:MULTISPECIES: Na+/H+ antiporter NhaC family protein [Pontibacter]MBJ6116569.1 Na+/H+ antiporter NhaC family protein [Pontibacter sp. BT310]MBR0568993.1 Na+/H+ antiporter NhaC family protein [Microvirga sp. STS03]MBW3363422.1 Na+/H+ antiporter NhaC family protein [Pontibacter populi]